MVKHRMNIRDEESTQIIWETLYIQYLLGSDSFISKAAFDSSFFVEILKRMVIEQLYWFKDLNDHTVMCNWIRYLIRPMITKTLPSPWFLRTEAAFWLTL